MAVSTLEGLYTLYKTQYIFNNGQAKFNKIEEKILNSAKIAQLLNLSITHVTDPSEADFGAHIHSITYFIFANAETCAMGELIAMKHWDEKVNARYNFCSDHALCLKGEAVFRRWKIRT